MTKPIKPTESHLTTLMLDLLDQTARLTMRLLERLTMRPLRFSEERRKERILRRLQKALAEGSATTGSADAP